MPKLIEKVTGDLSEKRRWRAIQRRAKALPDDYRTAYFEIQKYIWVTSGVETIRPFETLLDLFEEGAASGRKVLDLTGPDVAGFVDDLVHGEQSYFEKRRAGLNQALAEKLGGTA